MNGDECGPQLDISELAVCRVCGEVHGPVRERNDAERGVARDQRCDCAGPRRRPESWPGYDFPRAVELCRCCGRAALPSGSRWSVWFCSACQPLLCAINAACGVGVLPLGRHSLMAQIGLSTDAPEASVAPFVRELNGFFERVEQLETYARRVVRRNLALLDLAETDGDVPLPLYLGRLPRTEPAIVDAVRALGDDFGVPREILDRATARP